jgi:hypothetical protein
MSDAELIADLRGKGFGVMEKAADRIEQLVASNEYLNSRLENVLSREAEVYAKHKEQLEALTEQRDEACRDAVEAEAYAMELERDLKTCCMAQVVMDNTVAEAVKMLDEQDRKYNRMTNDMIERHSAKLAECLERNALLEARLGKAVEALREWDDLIKHQYSGSREAMSDMTYAAQHTAALLADIEGEEG